MSQLPESDKSSTPPGKFAQQGQREYILMFYGLNECMNLSFSIMTDLLIQCPITLVPGAYSVLQGSDLISGIRHLLEDPGLTIY